MSEKQTIVTFDSDAKPPNYGPMKLHTKPLKRRETGKNVSKWEKYQFDDEYDESPLITHLRIEDAQMGALSSLITLERYAFICDVVASPWMGVLNEERCNCAAPTERKDMFSGADAKDTGLVKKDTGLVEKDIVLVMSQTCVTREMAIATLRKHDGDIVNAIVELIETC